MILSQQEARQKEGRLRDLLALLSNPQWQEFARRLTRHHREHLEAATDRARTPEQRTAHIEAYHLARELEEWLPLQLESLQEELTDYRQKQSAGALEFEHEVDLQAP